MKSKQEFFQLIEIRESLEQGSSHAILAGGITVHVLKENGNEIILNIAKPDKLPCDLFNLTINDFVKEIGK